MILFRTIMICGVVELLSALAKSIRNPAQDTYAQATFGVVLLIAGMMVLDRR